MYWRATRCKGVCPNRPQASTFAPLDSSTFTSSMCPRAAATVNAWPVLISVTWVNNISRISKRPLTQAGKLGSFPALFLHNGASPLLSMERVKGIEPSFLSWPQYNQNSQQNRHHHILL